MPRPARATLLRSAAGLLVSLLLLAGLEGGLRLALGPPPPPVPVFTAVAEQARYFEVTDGMVRPTYQFQSPIPPFPARSDTPRVAFLGGSSVHGGVRELPTAREFPALVERLTGVQTVNLANPALDSHDTVRIVEELMSFSFATIVVYDGHNDFGNIYFNRRYVGVASLSARMEALLGRLQTFSALRDTLREPGSEVGQRVDSAEFVTTEQRRVALAGLEANLRRVAWITREHGVKLVLGTPVSCLSAPPDGPSCIEQPCAVDLARRAKELQGVRGSAAEIAKLYEEARDVDPIPLRAPRAAIGVVRRVARDEGALLVDVVADFPREAALDLPDCAYLADNVHFNEAGHRVMAALFAPGVKAAAAP